MVKFDYAARYRRLWKLAEKAYAHYLARRTEESKLHWEGAVGLAREAYQDVLSHAVKAPSADALAAAHDVARLAVEKADARLRKLEAQLKEKRKEEAPLRACAARGEYRAKRRQSVPTWLTKAQRIEIREVYREARAKKHHVDHIIPLAGKFVCGLHVPWNLQVLPPLENIRKGNRLAA